MDLKFLLYSTGLFTAYDAVINLAATTSGRLSNKTSALMTTLVRLSSFIKKSLGWTVQPVIYDLKISGVLTMFILKYFGPGRDILNPTINNIYSLLSKYPLSKGNSLPPVLNKPDSVYLIKQLNTLHKNFLSLSGLSCSSPAIDLMRWFLNNNLSYDYTSNNDNSIGLIKPSQRIFLFNQSKVFEQTLKSRLPDVFTNGDGNIHISNPDDVYAFLNPLSPNQIFVVNPVFKPKIS